MSSGRRKGQGVGCWGWGMLGGYHQMVCFLHPETKPLNIQADVYTILGVIGVELSLDIYVLTFFPKYICVGI